MANIVKHIEHLLLTNDCVIVPGFGGFISHHVPAHYDNNEMVFLPSQRSLGFNARLTMNDSILVQSYVEVYSMSYPDALKEVEQDVESIRVVLSEKGCYDFGGIGTLYLNSSGYDFQPNASGLLTPSLYAFGALEISSLATLRKLQLRDTLAINQGNVNTIFSNNESGEGRELFNSADEEQPYVITIQRKTVRRVMMTAAAVALAVVVSLPVKFSNGQNSGLIQSAVTPTLPAVKPADKAEGKPTVKVTAKQVVTPEAKPVEVAPEAKPVVVSPAINEHNYYTIVMANGITRKSAENYAKHLLEDDGIETIVTDGEKPMVLFGKYATAEKAQSAIAEHKDCKKFNIAWVYNVRR